jgi:tRNA(adenine34) deaminase
LIELPSRPPDEIIERTFELANNAEQNGEVPVGSIICRLSGDEPQWEIIAEEHNRIVERKDPTAHAELLAIKKASEVLNNERLNDCVMVTTLEPCTMCAGALILSRVEAVYYLAPGLKGIGMSELLEISLKTETRRFNHHPEMIIVPERTQQAASALKEFFSRRRGN